VRWKGNNGFSLLEVMIAVAILAVSLLAFMNFQSQSLMAAGRAQRISIATLLARQKMVQVLLEVEQGIPRGDFPDEREEEGVFEEELYPDYFWKLTINKFELPTPELGEEQGEILVRALNILSEELTRSSREVRLTVGWTEFEDEEEEGITVVTHIINFLARK